MRKILIGVASLGVVLGAYLLYSRMSGMPEIDTDRGAGAIESPADGNAVGLEGQTGKIGDMGVGPAEKAYYVTRDLKTQEIVREFGFEKLLHQVRDVWEIEKPYMNVYRRNFKCYVTADRGQVHVETVVGRTTPKDATFSSNVVIHVVPAGSSSIKESFVYLDDIIFLSERSLLSTAGPVRFESEDAQMHGTGLELIYNEHAERLEFFKIAHLESMTYRATGSQMALLSSTQTPTEGPAGSDERAEAKEPNETTMAGASGEKKSPPPEVPPPVEQPQGEYYKCVLNDNVLIETPAQLIFADEKLQICDIFWSKALIDPADSVTAGGTDETGTAGPVEAQDRQSATSIAEPNAPARPAPDRGISEPAEPNESPEESARIVVTCDGGLIIVPRGSRRAPDDSTQAGAEVSSSQSARPRQLDDGTERTKFFARTIDYSALTGDVIAAGPSELTYYEPDAKTTEANEPPLDRGPAPVRITARRGGKYLKASNQVVFTDCLCTIPQVRRSGAGRTGLSEPRNVTFSAPQITVDLPEEKSRPPDILAVGPAELVFYVEDANRPAVEGELIPVTVNARKRARYSAALNQMAFEGDCRCTMRREDPNVLEEYVLLSERMTVDLAEDANRAGLPQTAGPAGGIEHLTATGEVVRLATTRIRRPSPDRKTQDDEQWTTDDEQRVPRAEGVLREESPGPPSNSGQPVLSRVEEAAHGTLGGVELKCRQFDYDAVQQLYWATGPGIIKLNNAVPADFGNLDRTDPNEHPGPFSLREPCWAIMGGFDTLRYSLRDNRILADAAPQEKLWVIYAPMGRETKRDVTATASHVEAFLRETADGEMELSTLNATGGILYEDDRNHQFIGSELFYDHATAIVKVKGDEAQPCYYNGILVDGIKYDVNADKIEFNVVGPGTIQLGR